MPSAAAVVACALALLGAKRGARCPRSCWWRHRPKHASIQAEAFVSCPIRTIYVVTSSPVFREAMASRSECSDSLSLKKLASILAHEEWHITSRPRRARRIPGAAHDAASSRRAA